MAKTVDEKLLELIPTVIVVGTTLKVANLALAKKKRKKGEIRLL